MSAVEVDISLRVASNTGGVVDARLGRRHRRSDALPFHAGRASDNAPCHTAVPNKAVKLIVVIFAGS